MAYFNLKTTGNISPALLMAMLVASPAVAQQKNTDTTSAKRAGVEELVVTARRVSERLADVPVAVTALSGKMLEERGIQDVLGLSASAPGLNISPGARGSASPFVVLRGQRVIDTTAVLDPPVLFYVNEVPFMRVNGLNQSFFDTESIQVLRGPQGTLFGKSTTGGAILVNSVRPNLDAVEGYAKFTAGDYNLLRLEGAINLPITDSLAIRFAGTVSKRDGYIRVRNMPGYALNNENYNAQRLSILYDNGTFRNDLIVNRYSERTNGTATQVVGYDPNAPFFRFLPAGTAAAFDAEIAAQQADYFSVGLDFRTTAPRARSLDITNISTYEISDGLTVKNIAAYREIDFPFLWNFDGSALVYQEFTDYADVWQFSEEVQILGQSESFDWTVGAFYLREKGRDGAYIHTVSTNRTNESGTGITNTSYSAFASGTYRFALEGLSATAGVRVSHDKREGRGVQTTRVGTGPTICTFSGVTLTPPDCVYKSEKSFTEPSWSTTLDYKVNPGLLLYVAHRHGYRTGGVQHRATTLANAVPYDAETVNDLELGAKLDTALNDDTNLVFNVAAYQAWYSGLQRSLNFVSPGTTTIVSGIVSAADAEVRGIEIEASLLTAGGFELSGSLGYTDTKFTNFNQSISATTAADLSGQPFSLVPKWTWNLRAGYTYEMDNPGEALNATVNLSHVGKVFTNEGSLVVGKVIDGYELVNAQVSWTSVGGSNCDLTVSATNLLNKKYATGGASVSDSLGFAFRYPGAPRQVRGSITAHF